MIITFLMTFKFYYKALIKFHGPLLLLNCTPDFQHLCILQKRNNVLSNIILIAALAFKWQYSRPLKGNILRDINVFI